MAANVGPGSSASVDVVLDESDKYVLDVSSTNQHSMWLLKVPQADLAAAIETALDREEIGFLKELVEPIVESKRTAAASSDRPRKKPKCEIDVAESLAERFDGRRRIAAEVAAEKEGTSVIHPVAVNRHYDMAFRDRKESMAVFSEETQDDGGIKSVALEGKIVANAHTSLQDFATIRKRIDTSARQSANRRVAKEISSKTGARHSFNPISAHVPTQRREVKQKRTAFGLSDDVIKQRLFKRFEDHEYYSLKDLAALEKLPDDRVRQVLHLIADRAPAGPHKGKWHLKASHKVAV
eukprot:m.194798 g.194798  ORF g.194798 m.194798 type:complete len:295 (+) comp18663_c0_seq6:262-1146(+)